MGNDAIRRQLDQIDAWHKAERAGDDLISALGNMAGRDIERGERGIGRVQRDRRKGYARAGGGGRTVVTLAASQAG